MPLYDRLAIIGVGFIGGSVGRAVRERGIAKTVIGIGRRQASLDLAQQHQAIDQASLSVEEGVAGADFVLAATPIEHLASTLTEAAKHAPQAWLTDAGSTKTQLCQQLAENSPDTVGRFVGSHPLAGGHRTGPDHAQGDLFVDRTVVVTPTADTRPETTQRVTEFWNSLGSQTLIMSPDKHDQALAATSHLPHLVSYALAAATPPDLLPLTSTGWEDTTRIAASDPALWQQIFASNREALLDCLQRYEDHLHQLRSACQEQDWTSLKNQLTNAKRVRDALGD